MSYMKDDSLSNTELVETLKLHYTKIMKRDFPKAWVYYNKANKEKNTFFDLNWDSYALIRIMDFLYYEGKTFIDGNLYDKQITSTPISLMRKLFRNEECDVTIDFALDILHLLRQLNGIDKQSLPSKKQITIWMDNHPSGLDRDVIKWRKQNKERIINLLIKKIRKERSFSKTKKTYTFKDNITDKQARRQVLKWWNKDRFHLHFAVNNVQELNSFLDNSLDEETLKIMNEAEKKGIPIFATPYFLSLIDVRSKEEKSHPFADEALRSYLFYNQDLVDEFGNISAWEKEDIVKVGEPNVAGWVIPSHNIHRRYPNVAIFIPDTMGRACGGLCAYCQRMYDFQNGRFNFNLKKLQPKKSWLKNLDASMSYFKNDPFLEDILITGGDALMSSVSSLKKVLDSVLIMAEEKKLNNKDLPRDEQLAEIKKVRLGTKLPVYLPQRVTKELIDLLKDFKIKAQSIGITKCVVQTHISSAMEITPETEKAIRKILHSGWAVSNQEVFTVAASRRGHSAKLRHVLNNIGVLPYYTFTVKGFKENRELFANNSRSIQEQVEEKCIGYVDEKYNEKLKTFILNGKVMVKNIDSVRKDNNIPFIATDRNTLNLPGVGKSNTYRTIGLTNDGRRILKFEFDHTRPHSPVIEKMSSVIIIESKSIAQYLRQLEKMGEDIQDYTSIWGYSIGRMEPISPVFEREEE